MYQAAILILFSAIVLAYNTANAQLKRNSDLLLVHKNHFVLVRGDSAYHEIWSPKKMSGLMIYHDTLIRQNDSTYLGTKSVLLKSSKGYTVMGRHRRSKPLHFNPSTIEQQNNWNFFHLIDIMSLYEWKIFDRLDSLKLDPATYRRLRLEWFEFVAPWLDLDLDFGASHPPRDLGIFKSVLDSFSNVRLSKYLDPVR